MEYEVGEIFELDGKKYQVIEDDEYDCKNCSFNPETCFRFDLDSCMSQYRQDNKNINFKLVEEKISMEEKIKELQIQEIQQEWENNRKKILIISNKGSVFVDVIFSPNNIDTKIEIWGLYVNKENRNSSVGKILLHYAEKVAKKYGNRIEIQWISSTPKWTYEWYLREGYTEFEFDEGYSKLYKIV